MIKIAWADIYVHPLPAGHRFPMEKYQLIHDQLLYEGTIIPEQLMQPDALSEENLLTTHNIQYWNKLKNGQLTALEVRRTGFPYSYELILRERVIMEGTRIAATQALQYGIAINIAGGTHHAFTDMGEGFCLLNDMAIAANFLLLKNLAKKILIIDLDVHQGNGTAEIFQSNAKVFTFSMHCANNFPAKKEISDLDVPLADKTSDKEYLEILNKILPSLIEKEKPDFIFFQSGVDVLGSDKLGKLSLTRVGCKNRDRIVLELCKKYQIPVTISMGGGYSEKIIDIVEAHCNTFRLAEEIFS